MDGPRYEANVEDRIGFTMSRFLPVIVSLVVGAPSGLFAQWVTQSSGTTEQLNDVAIIDSTTAIVVGNSGIVLKTTNLGAMWIPKSVGTTRSLRSTACYLDAVYAVGDLVVCYSSDRGETWDVDSSSEHTFSVVEYGALPNSDLYMGTELGLVRYQRHPGQPWTERALQGARVVCMGLQYGAGQSTYASIVTLDYAYSTNGIWWDSVAIPRQFWDFLTGGNLKGSSIQYLVGFYGNGPPQPFILQRENWQDTSWQRFNLPTQSRPYDVKSSGNGATVYVCGSGRSVHRSIDSGATWTFQYGNMGNYTKRLLAMAFTNDTVGYAVGDSGTILFTPNGGVTSVGQDNSGYPEYAALFQNYPNPFNPTTNIEFQIPKSEFVSLKVFDVLGREVQTLVNGKMDAGVHRSQFDSEELPSGVYLYRLSSTGVTISKKMLLIR